MLSIRNLLTLSLISTGIFSTGPVRSLELKEACAGADLPTNFSAYRKNMLDRFEDNLPLNTPVPKEPVIRFFLTNDGFIRDLSLQKSSGRRATDLACIDAILCSSPLPPPPLLRTALPPPPLNELLPPDSYGWGIYKFSFEKRKAAKMVRVYTNADGKVRSMKVLEGDNAAKFHFKIIPNEVQYRYPGLFTSKELSSTSNLFPIKTPTASHLEDARFQWAVFYKNHPSASKEEVTRRGREIIEHYFPVKKTTASQ